MFFVASKIGWLLVQPLSLILILLLAGLLLLMQRRRRSGATAIGLALLAYLLCGYTSLGAVLIQPLEERFARPVSPPARVDGIVVLGGGVDTGVAEARDGYELNAAGDRFLEALRLARLYPTARVLFAGTPEEAAAARRFSAAVGLADGRLLIDDQSRNTAENVAFGKALAKPVAGQTWLLVTSAWHMPRAVGLFREAGFEVIPWPVDYRSQGTSRFEVSISDPAQNFASAGTAVHEWIGLLAYWLTGRIATPFPAPEPPATVN
jgi:uncharacterized SAM-binding protein YcdF (DUF218 family)